MPLPLLAIGGIGALAGGISNLLGGNPEQDKYDQYINYLMNEKQRVRQDANKQRGDLSRLISARTKDRRLNKLAQNNQAGVDNPTASSTGEEDLTTAEVTGMSSIDQTATAQQAELDKQAAMAELNRPVKKGSLQNFFEGALSGVDLGVRVGSALGIKPDTSNDKGTEGDNAGKSGITTTPPSTVVTPDLNTLNSINYDAGGELPITLVQNLITNNDTAGLLDLFKKNPQTYVKMRSMLPTTVQQTLDNNLY